MLSISCHHFSDNRARELVRRPTAATRPTSQLTVLLVGKWAKSPVRQRYSLKLLIRRKYGLKHGPSSWLSRLIRLFIQFRHFGPAPETKIGGLID